MNPTPTIYFGEEKNYKPKANIPESYDEFFNCLADVIFEELVNDKRFIEEADKAISKVVRDPNKLPNISVKYKKLFDK